MRSLKIYLKSMRLNHLSAMQYKGWYFMIIQVVMVVVSDPISIVLMFQRFGDIGEWSFWRIILIYSIAVTSFGLAETFARGFDYFPWRMIRTGDFDRLLLRPCSLVVQVACSYFHIHRAARVVSGLIVVFLSLYKLDAAINLQNMLILISALIGGFTAYTGIFMMTSGIAFFTIKGLDWIYIFTNASYQVTRCPIDYMPKLLKNMFTFFLPILLISLYPASVICGWGEPLWKGMLALPAGLIFFTVSLAVWRIGVLKYKSTGS